MQKKNFKQKNQKNFDKKISKKLLQKKFKKNFKQKKRKKKFHARIHEMCDNRPRSDQEATKNATSPWNDNHPCSCNKRHSLGLLSQGNVSRTTQPMRPTNNYPRRGTHEANQRHRGHGRRHHSQVRARKRHRMSRNDPWSVSNHTHVSCRPSRLFPYPPRA